MKVLVPAPGTYSKSDPAFLLLVNFYFNHHKRTRSLRAKRDAQSPKATTFFLHSISACDTLPLSLPYLSTKKRTLTDRFTLCHSSSLLTSPPLHTSFFSHHPPSTFSASRLSQQLYRIVTPLATFLQQISYGLRLTSQVSLTPTRYKVDDSHIHLLLTNHRAVLLLHSASM